MPKLYGIGVGPGDPELMTLKALKILERVEILFVPKSGAGVCIALDIVKKAINKDFRIVKLYFPMTKDKRKLEEHWDIASKAVEEALKDGSEGAFITLGDPLFYSTFSYLMPRILGLGIDIEVIPGITSISSCSASRRITLVAGDEKLAVIPAAYGLENLEHIAEEFDTVVLIKVSRNYNKIVDKIKELGLEDRALFMSRCGGEGFRAKRLEGIGEGNVDYLSMIIIR